MQNEKDESATLPLDEVFVNILDMMKHMVSDAGGLVPQEMIGAFEEIAQDKEGNKYIQTIAGSVMTTPEGLENNQLFYSPNIGVDSESVAIETANLVKYSTVVGWDLIVCTGHYVDMKGAVSYGDEARRCKGYVEQTLLLNRIKKMQEDIDSQPKLVLPETKIITR